MDGLTPNQSVQTPEINFGQTAGNPFAGIGVDVGTDDFAGRWSGKINISTGGPITFYTNSDDGSAT